MQKATPADWERLGRRYLERAARWRGRRAVFTDKGLGNWRYLGVALSMLPGARFVNIRRDPVETCLSCFRQSFSIGQDFTSTWGEVAQVWHVYDRSMRFWRKKFPDRIYEVVYEDLLADPESELRKLLAFCGFEFDPACLDFRASTGRFAPPAWPRSANRCVRDTAKAHLYGDLLAPLRRALAVA